MGTTYTLTPKLVGYSDSAQAGGRYGRSAFNILVDFAKAGAAAATGLVSTDVLDEIGALPQNCVVRTVCAQVVKPITVLSADGISAIPLVLKAGSTTLATFGLAALNGPSLGAEWIDVATPLVTGATGVAGTKNTLSLTVGAVLDDAETPTATAISGGVVSLTFFVDYLPEVDELTALFQATDEVSDGGNTATEITSFGLGYS